MIDKHRKELLELIKSDAYFREKVILSSGKESDYYIDARIITLQPRGVYLVAEQILALIENDSIDAIGGPTLGADPMIGAVGVLSLERFKHLTTFIIRKQAKSHGKQKQIEGPVLKKGSRVVIIDDVATTGKAFLESIDVLHAMNIEVVKAICIVDRGEGAKEAVAAKGCEMVSIFNINEIHVV